MGRTVTQQSGAKRAKMAAEARRHEVEKMLLAGYTYRDMRARLGVSLATISKDVAIVRRRWTKELNPQDRKAWITRDLQKLASLEQKLTALIERELGEGEGEAADPVTAGELFGAAHRLLQILKRRATMLGLDAPAKTAFTDPEGKKSGLVVFLPVVDGQDEDGAEPAPLPEPGEGEPTE